MVTAWINIFINIRMSFGRVSLERSKRANGREGRRGYTLLSNGGGFVNESG